MAWLCVLLLLSFLILPVKYQHKIQRLIVLPYHLLYTMELKDIIESRRSEMERFYNDESTQGKEAYIAHGGGVGDFHYTNCMEAVMDSIEKGFKYIEIDMLETIDGHFVGGHGWGDLSYLTGTPAAQLKQMTTPELKGLKIREKYTILTSEDIKAIMEKYPEIVLVTDIVSNFELLTKEIPYTDRMIVEVYGGPYFYQKALEAGIRYPAYSITSLNTIEKYGFPIVVMPADYFKKAENIERIKKLHKKKITILVHKAAICDKADFIKNNLSKNISLIYTNEWYPTGPSPVPVETDTK